MHRFVVRSPKDALRALIAMVPGFERELMTSKDRGVRYAVFVGKRNLAQTELEYPSGQDDIRIAPVVTGRKAGLWMTIAGVALAAVGAVSMYFGNPYGGQMMLMGASMAFGGISQMISANATASNGSGNTTQSYYFSGAENTTTQGGPVPLLYGEMVVGSTVISSGIQATDT
ncbi:tail assembly protein [Pararobbsia alpina]|uniref:tail assembly protein n=1 Tax=Pararobbsia alpina TaxID=621374 RepID=UPI0031B5C52C